MSESNTNDILGFIVRLLGLVILVIGLTVALKVIIEAWDLYKQPQNIERFAKAIEQGSGLDSLINNIAKPNNGSINTLNESFNSSPKPSEQNKLRLTYFVAWILVVLLLLVIGGLAMSAIKTGGQLALYDLQVKRFAREVLEEAKKKHDTD
jgi:Na+/proline symporter